MKNNQVPLWIKLSYTLMVCVIVPIYWHEYGPTNFLWFCDIGMLVMLAALWLESRLLTSMMALGVLPLEIFWFIGFFTGGWFLSIADYMFDSTLPLYLRALSLYHFPMPAVTIFMLMKFKYDTRALRLQILLVTILLPVTRWITPEEENINWVFQPEILQDLSVYMYIPLITATLILVVYIPMHFVLKKYFPIN
ncbi:hypothetical protein N9W34_05550 [Rickettsiales bacterium]|nr:hypothetical protein [Rickettsiales bacterium]